VRQRVARSALNEREGLAGMVGHRPLYGRQRVSRLNARLRASSPIDPPMVSGSSDRQIVSCPGSSALLN
jgi:hypothetical protein